MFALAGSSWADYDRTVISEGGGVYARTAKSVELSPATQEALGIDVAVCAPDELVRAVLRAPVDVLWNGGIGTFVKASSERNLEVADKTNDGTRVDASELRCRIVVEGGNLGFTQAARVEYALAGGRINTDAIDNSAGVDCSDHEVNLKVLLGSAMARGELDRAARDVLLESMTDDVAAHVLADNAAQATALELALAEAPSLLEVHARAIDKLEARGALDRELEGLPAAARSPSARRRARASPLPSWRSSSPTPRSGCQVSSWRPTFPTTPPCSRWRSRTSLSGHVTGSPRWSPSTRSGGRFSPRCSRTPS